MTGDCQQDLLCWGQVMYTRQAGHVHPVGTLDLSDYTVGISLSRQGSDEDYSRVLHFVEKRGWLWMKKLLRIELS